MLANVVISHTTRESHADQRRLLHAYNVIPKFPSVSLLTTIDCMK